MGVLLILIPMIVIALLYFNVFTFPQTGIWVDLPAKFESFLGSVGDPFVILFWLAVIAWIWVMFRG